ncbi:MAG: thermonuclease family protein [Planctomycetota bacterium]|jgi:hypothetical protein|nr:thermonuclease family protein [Planctomycetota bacterium]
MRHSLTLLLCLAGLLGSLAAADPVLAVTGPDSVIVAYKDLPVQLSLAHIEVPPEMSAACQARLAELLDGQEVQVIYKEEFGTNAIGAALVHLKAGSKHINLILVTEGLARYKEGEAASSYGRMLSMSQDRAKEDGKGLWGQAVVVAAAEPAAPAAEPAKPAASKTGPIVAELRGTHYYASDDPRAAKIPERRRIYYRSEDAAKRAGKRAAPAAPSRAAAGGNEADADRILSEAKQTYANAIDAGNSTKRDDLYGEAFNQFTSAMTIYSDLVEQRPDDAALAEKLRETMQLRYGAMKQRRF